MTGEPGVLTYLADKGFDPAFGARPLKRLIQQDISNLIAKGILNGNISGDCALMLQCQDDELSYFCSAVSETNRK